METFESAIGIDLGLSYSRVAVWRSDEVHVMTNKYNTCNFPSCFAHNNSENFVQLGKYELFSVVKPENTIYDVKRLIGKRYPEVSQNEYFEKLPFEIEASGNNTPVIPVIIAGERKLFKLEYFNAKILSNMKEAAENYLDMKVNKAVISAPTHFTDAQCEAIKEAGRVAGLEILRIVNEPTAAAIAYDYDILQDDETHNVLVCNFGGGEFEVTLLSAYNGDLEVRATGNARRINGEDFDNRLVEFFCEKIEQKYFPRNIEISKATQRLIQLECMRVKEELSSETSAIFKIEPLFDDIKFELKITREEFEEKCDDLFEGVRELINDVLENAKMSKDILYDVILAGGSTRIPKIQSLLQSYENGRLVRRSFNVDEITVIGAAIRAENPNGDDSTDFENFLKNNRLKYGIKTDLSAMSYILNYENIYKSTNPRVFLNQENQTEARVEVYLYRGCRLWTELLPKKVYKIVGLPCRPRGTLFIYVKLELDVHTRNVIIKAYKTHNFIENNAYEVRECDCTRSRAKHDFLLNKETQENKEGGWKKRFVRHLEQIDLEINRLLTSYVGENIPQQTRREVEQLQINIQNLINRHKGYSHDDCERQINSFEEKLNELRGHSNAAIGAAFPQTQQDDDDQDNFDQGAAQPTNEIGNGGIC